jgi:hypothetical protein
MATLCLVHGSTQNARCWDLLIPELARHGHQVITVDLPKSEPHFGVSDFAAVILREMPPTVSDRNDSAAWLERTYPGWFTAS